MPDDTPHFAAAWLDEFGDRLFSYALPRVGGDVSLAEDLVQETLLSALRSYARFEGRSSVDTWLISILRRKILDYYRKRYQRQGDSTERWEGILEEVPEFKNWASDAAEAYKNQEFREIFDRCLSDLSPPLAEAFVACVLDGLETQEACKLLEVSPTNLSVRVHRARLALRVCLQRRWFEGG